jgi:hypothetical protein
MELKEFIATLPEAEQLAIEQEASRLIAQEQPQRWCEAHQTDHPIGEFYRVKDASYAEGYRYRCKQLTKERNAATAKAAPEGSKLRETQRRVKRDWAKQHPENARRNSANYRARKAQAEEPPPGPPAGAGSASEPADDQAG